MGEGYDVRHGGLDGVAGRLRGASAELEAGAGGAPSVDAGEVTGAVTGLLGALSASLAGVVEGIAAAGDAVTSDNQAYAEVDDANRRSLDPRPR